ncbi:MAG TPA: glutamate synthase [Desulfohalobiaceae bacterium]|nr:glutamate synthase [Desulfohalobiaceae bacterium]
MCRLFAVTSHEPQSPMLAIQAMEAMKEGHDGSGVGLLLTDLGGPFEYFKDSPILSGIFSHEGLKRLDHYMMEIGFTTKYRFTVQKASKESPPGIPQRDIYLIRAYDYPEDWESFSEKEIRDRLMNIRLTLREMGQENQDMIVFSFWPDVIMIKEIGDPKTVAEYLQWDHQELRARIILAQGRQNTNYAIDLYACHPFFLQGFASMTNGENTAFIPIKEFLSSRNFQGYTGYQSDSEVLTHILHYGFQNLQLGIEHYKHIITPLPDEQIAEHKEGDFLRQLKQSCRRLIIDGPNCIIGCLPDKTLFMAQDRKKLRPGVVGGKPGFYVFCSELCGLNAVVPEDSEIGYHQPMHLDTAIVGHEREEVKICSQVDRLTLHH